MKKLLLSFLLLFPTLADAKEFKYQGYEFEAKFQANAYYGFNSLNSRYDDNNDSTGFVGDAELNMSVAKDGYSLHLDLTGGANKEDKSYNNGSWGKEIYGVIDKDFGQITLGETYNVADRFHQGPKAVNSVDVADFIGNPNWEKKKHFASYKTLNSTAVNTDGVAPKITYITPEYKNTYAGFSYINNINNRRGLSDKQLHYEDNHGYVGSVYNEQDLGFAGMTAALSYAEFRKDDKELAASVSFSRGGWTLSGGYRKAYVDGGAPDNINDNYREGYAWDVGLGYEIGPFETELSYFQSQAENTDNEDKIIQLSNTYSINKNFKAYANIAHVDFRGEDRAVENNNKGYTFIIGFGVEF